MIQFMLTDLCRPAAEFLSLFFPVHIIIFYFDIFISCCFPHTGKRQTSFFCFIRSILAQQNRIKHHDIYESHIYNDYSLFHTDHFVLRTQSRARSHAYMPAWRILTLPSRIFAAMPTHPARFACKVSCKSFPTCRSAFVAGSDFPDQKVYQTFCLGTKACPRKNTSFIISFTIYYSSTSNHFTLWLYQQNHISTIARFFHFHVV